MKNSKALLPVFLVPFTFFYKTRIKSFRDWMFLIWTEWLIGILILLYAFNGDLFAAVCNYFLGYFCFITFYEIGYIVNDIVSVRKEAAPRKRFGETTVSNFWIVLWIIARLAIFVLLSTYLEVGWEWIFYYTGLGLVFALHNVFKDGGLKTFTFLQLATFRFFAPLFFFISPQLLQVLLPVAVLYYVFNRTLTYMESKSILVLPQRTSPLFRLQTHLVLLIFTAFWAYYTREWICLVVAGYYTFFWLINVLRGAKTATDE